MELPLGPGPKQDCLEGGRLFWVQSEILVAIAVRDVAIAAAKVLQMMKNPNPGVDDRPWWFIEWDKSQRNSVRDCHFDSGFGSR